MGVKPFRILASIEDPPAQIREQVFLFAWRDTNPRVANPE